MRISKNNIFIGIAISGIITDILILLNVSTINLRAIVPFLFLAVVPGLLIMLSLRIRKLPFWEYAVYAIALSLLFLMTGGLLANWLLPLIRIPKPLATLPILFTINIYLIICFSLAYKRNGDLSWKIVIPKLSALNWLFAGIPVTFPVLSIMGAFSLNNSGPNIFTMLLLGSMALNVLLVVRFRKSLPEYIIPEILYFMALALLLMTSLRSWFITGHDIQEEFYIFQLTKAGFHWDMSLFKDAYNACLSLNILPTIYSSLTNIRDVNIYKVYYQLLFPFSAIGTYLLVRRYTAPVIAFLSAFLYMAFPTFGNDMPYLNRQEIALLFFTSGILILFNKKISSGIKHSLFLTFGAGMAVSHYSTSYIAIALFVSTYVFSVILRRKFKKIRLRNAGNRYFLTPVMVVGLCLITFVWNTQLTHTSNGLVNVFAETWQNIGKSFSRDMKSQDVVYSLFNWKGVDKNKLLAQYVAAQEAAAEPGNNYKKYAITFTDDAVLPLTRFGAALRSIHVNPYALHYYFKQGSAKLVQVLLLIGFLLMLFRKYRHVAALDSEYLILAGTGILLLGVFIILPAFSVEYGTLRFFQQSLILLALPVIVGAMSAGLYFSAGFIVLFFLSLYGFIPQLTGGFYPTLNLNNDGIYYNEYYTHATELASRSWLLGNYNKDFPVQENYDSKAKLFTFLKVYSFDRILPALVQKNSYVYLNYSNVNNQRDTIFYNSVGINYAYPINFLNENKNLIYNNGGSEIYK